VSRRRLDIPAVVLHHDEQAVLVAVEMAPAEGIEKLGLEVDLPMGIQGPG